METPIRRASFMSVTLIPVFNLILCFLPFILILFLFYRFSLDWKELIYGSVRMLGQLIGVGYLLKYIFEKNEALWSLSVVLIMLILASWISLRSFKSKRKILFLSSLQALAIGSFPVLFWTTVIVLPGERWQDPTFLIPLTGIFISNSMNAIGIAVERYFSEIGHRTFEEARRHAFQASLIRDVNTFFAVGVVSLPGLMTGQILSGVDPLIAVRYQIVIMTMVITSSGLSVASFLFLIHKQGDEAHQTPATGN